MSTQTLERQPGIPEGMDRLLTARQVEKLLQISDKTLRKLVTEGHLQRVQMPGVVRYRASDVAAFMGSPVD